MAAKLEGGIIYIESDEMKYYGCIHPVSALHEWGADWLRSIPRDISAEQLEAFIAAHPQPYREKVDILKHGQ